ncbi:MAG: DUF72 domain-containing protein [Bacteroidetes bacterium]|jgi:uncharacterized protein YecE (DUF72 family)|nr:DUF72 domain-containing protein [Bacteroidota bacterium]
MKFGKVKDPANIDFFLPDDHPATARVLSKYKSGKLKVYVGCPKWNKTDLKGFYPRGIKDELEYYASQFNSIELNATFYNKFSADQISGWANKTPDDFRFFPKMHQMVSHYKGLNKVDEMVEEFCNEIAGFEDRLGMVFMQLHDNFKFRHFDRLKYFIENFPAGIPLALELRNAEFFKNEKNADELAKLLEINNVTHILTDTAGRRDLLHMRLTTPNAFIRYVGSNHPSDYTRLDDWIERLKTWKEAGLQNVYFFVHQHIEKEMPMLASHFIKLANEHLDQDMYVPCG